MFRSFLYVVVVCCCQENNYIYNICKRIEFVFDDSLICIVSDTSHSLVSSPRGSTNGEDCDRELDLSVTGGNKKTTPEPAAVVQLEKTLIDEGLRLAQQYGLVTGSGIHVTSANHEEKHLGPTVTTPSPQNTACNLDNAKLSPNHLKVELSSSAGIKQEFTQMSNNSTPSPNNTNNTELKELR